MLILSLDTSSRAGSAALWHDGEIVGVRVGDPARTHAERLPADLCELLSSHDAGFRDIDLFAVAAGPGSFTGLRVGIATIQGFAFAHGRQVLPVSTLEALAWLGHELGAVPLVAAWVDAQRHEVFSALYRAAPLGEVETVDDPVAEAPAATLDRWQRRLQWKDVRFVGDGAVAYESLLLSHAGPSVEIVNPVPPLAPVIARIAAARAAQGRAISPHAVRPVYVRRPDAELARDRRQGGGPVSACPPETTWTIERLDPSHDLDEVVSIEASSFANPWTRAMFLSELAHARVSHGFVLRTPTIRVAGYCLVWVVFDEIHINNLAVRPECRRHGGGLALLRAVLAAGAALGGRRATLEVRQSNHAARRLYERLGFQVAGVRRRYYSHPEEDALVLWLEPVSTGLEGR